MHQEKSSLHPPSNSDCGQEAEAGYTGPASSQHKSLQASPRDRGVTVPDNPLCVPDRDLCCLSPSRTGILPANPGEPHAASPDSAQHGNKRGWQRNQSAWRPGAAVKPHQDSSSHGKQGFHFVPAAPTLEKLAGSEES